MSHSEIRPTSPELTRGWITKAEWTIYIEKYEWISIQKNSNNISIFRVPNLLKKSKIEFYVPQKVSLGPYHHRSAELHLMSYHKGRALHLMRTRFNNNYKDLANVDPNNMDFAHRAREEIEAMEIDIKNRYKEEIDCDGETLALMLSLDGCFILQILQSLTYSRFNRASNCYEPMFDEDYIVYSGNDILKDIVKLENQIPMIVLEKLLQLEFDSLDTQDYLLEILRSLLGHFYPVDRKDKERLWLWPQEAVVHHILGLMHSFIVSSLSDRDDPVAGAWRKWFKWSCVSCNLEKCISLWSKYMKCGNEWCRKDRKDSAVNNVRRIPRAIELKYAGIKFKACGAAGGTRMIKFDPKNATIFLPRIIINNLTEVLFRNLVAFEMCKPSEINYVTCYVVMMDELIDTGEDVDLLIRSGIVTNMLGDDAKVAEIFNCLSNDVMVSRGDAFAKLKLGVQKHLGNVVKVQLAQLVKEVKDQFSSPWKTITLVAAVVIALFTTVQTIFSVLSYYKY